jgi:hypothetical protein
VSDVTLDWASSEVRTGRLDVPLCGEVPPGWKEAFDRAAALLQAGDWGKIKCKADRVRVRDVAEGEEDRLHHFLESVVVQANASCEPDDDDASEEDGAGESGADAEMTARFRSFAPTRDTARANVNQ